MLYLRFFVVATLCGVLLSDEQVQWNQFRDFMVKYQKSYRNDLREVTKRFEVFKVSLERQKQLNLLEGSAVFGVNKFSDLTTEEFQARYLSGLQPSTLSIPKAQKVNLSVDLPAKFDWREQDAVTGVKNQLKCGSCWAFSISEGLESCYAIHYNKLVSLSTQQFISCDRNAQSYGCQGGTLGGAVDWLIEGKIIVVPDANYPFTSGDDTRPDCKANLPQKGVRLLNHTVKDYLDNEKGMAYDLNLVSPLSVTVNANIWQDYRGGIVRYHCTNTSIDHAVQVVGYDMTNDPPYWIVRNTWGPDWGVKGYIYIAMDKNLCGLAQTVYAFTKAEGVNL
ncbi:cathepsin O-like [Dysidea avara]|uniref:cathepsin O-like n=1 Tax=Dysidea avara TaxID=196820 RepID=UPI00332359E6